MIHGIVSPDFEAVKEAFARNFTEHGDQGASCAVCVDGELKVDLWGGVADVATGQTWDRDTVAIAFSVTKGATTILCHRLAEQRALDLDAPIATYWPEFAQAGKGACTTRMVLTHRVGLPLIDRRLSREDLLEGRLVASALALQTPRWAPNTAHGYHALTFGWLLGEIVHRATGYRLGDLFRQQVAGPLGLDLFIGLPPTEEPHVAHLVNAQPPDIPALLAKITDPERRAVVEAMLAAMGDPASPAARALSTNGALPTPDAATWNDPRVHAAEIPAANGITNARSLARMYAGCVGEVDGVRLLREDTVTAAVAERSAGPDRTLVGPTRFGTGFMLPTPTLTMLGESSFGHSGAGGALGFADRDARVGFGYVQNQLGVALAGEPRTTGVIAALKQVLDGRPEVRQYV